METVTCNLCHSQEQRSVYSKPDGHYFTDEWFTVVECLNCGLGFVNPRPTAAEMSRFYPADYYENDQREPAYHQRRYQLEAEIVQTITSPGGGLLLDIGCANGNFPRQMQKLGWEVEAVEISAHSEDVYGFQIYRKEFPQIPIQGPRYDAVTAWAVLEHVHDPAAHFRKVGEILKPGGVFVFLVTNFDSISSRALFREDVPRHLYFFTEKTVREYLSRNGLTFISSQYRNDLQMMRPVGWLRYYLYRLVGATLTWKDIPPNRTEYFARKGLKHGIGSHVRYVICHPLTVIDRLLMPLFEWLQIRRRTYGIVAYVARKEAHTS